MICPPMPPPTMPAMEFTTTPMSIELKILAAAFPPTAPAISEIISSTIYDSPRLGRPNDDGRGWKESFSRSNDIMANKRLALAPWSHCPEYGAPGPGTRPDSSASPPRLVHFPGQRDAHRPA